MTEPASGDLVSPLKADWEGRTMGKGCILWAVGVPIPVIILLYVFHVL